MPQRDISNELVELELNDTSTLVCHFHFVLSPTEREKRNRRDSRGDEREGKGRQRNRKESEESEEIKHSPSTLTCYKDSRPCQTISQSQLDALVTQNTRHLHHTRPPPPSNEYSQHMISWRNKNDDDEFIREGHLRQNGELTWFCNGMIIMISHKFCLFNLGLTSLSTFFSHIATVSGCGRELNAHF